MFIAPTHAGLPPLSYMLDDIPAPLPKLARHLGVSLRTLQRWRADEQAPRLAQLALFFETQWGREHVNCAAINDARMAYGLADSLRRQNAGLHARIARLEALGGFGSANAPMFDQVHQARHFL